MEIASQVTAIRSVSADLLVDALGNWQHNQPRYQSLAATIRSLVTSGFLPLDTRLPAERRLAERLGVSRTTISLAYSLLRSESYLYSRGGSGSYISIPFDQEQIRLIGWTPDVRAEGNDIDLTIAALPAPEPEITAASRDAIAELPAHTAAHGYDSAGLPSLREAVAKRFCQRDLPTSPDQIMITNGALQALWLAVRLATGPGERVLTQCPTYPNALDVIRAIKGRPVPIHMDEWRPDALTAAIRQVNPRVAYVIADFHNPTGQVMPEDSRAALVSCAEQTDTLVISDETLADLAIDDRPMPLPVAAWGAAGRVVTIGSVSKTFWAGLRIGWVRADPSTIQRLTELRATVDLGTPIVDQLIAKHLLDRATDIMPKRLASLASHRDLLAGELSSRLPGWRFTVPSGGLMLWIDLGSPVAKRLAAAARRKGVHLIPGERFGISPGTLENFIRIPYTLPEPMLAEAVRRLAHIWPELHSS